MTLVTSEPDPALSIVIVTYNSAEALPGLLDSIPMGMEGAGSYQVVIADNASSDKSAELAEQHATRPRVVRTGRNGGYAAGINAALEQVGPDANVLVLNPDVRLGRGCVRPLIERLRRPGAGVAAPRVLHEDGQLVFSIRREPSAVHTWADAILPGRIRALLGVGEVVTEAGRYQKDGTVDWASGAALAFSPRARKVVSRWEESYFLYSEEVEFQRRVRDAGLSVYFVPESEMVHIGGEYRTSPRLYAILTANRIRYFRKFHGKAATAIFNAGVIVSEALRVSRSSVHLAGLRAALETSGMFRAGQSGTLSNV